MIPQVKGKEFNAPDLRVSNRLLWVQQVLNLSNAYCIVNKFQLSKEVIQM